MEVNSHFSHRTHDFHLWWVHGEGYTLSRILGHLEADVLLLVKAPNFDEIIKCIKRYLNRIIIIHIGQTDREHICRPYIMGIMIVQTGLWECVCTNEVTAIRWCPLKRFHCIRMSDPITRYFRWSLVTFILLDTIQAWTWTICGI